MAGILVAAGLFFVFASIWQLSILYRQVEHEGFDLSPVFAEIENKNQTISTSGDLKYLRLKILSLLEQNVIERRYKQVNSVLIARTWTRYLGFTTGMILALVGAAFILGKIRESETTLSQETSALKFSLATSSPGIVLATLGTGLMALSLLVRFEINTRDVPLYITELSLPGPAVTNDTVRRTECELFPETCPEDETVPSAPDTNSSSAD